MKKIITIFVALVLVSTSNAQFFNRLHDAARSAAENAVQRNVENKVESGVNRAFEGNYRTNKKSNNEDESSSSSSENVKKTSGWICSSCGNSGNNGKFCNECGAKKPEENANGSWVCVKCGNKGNKGNFCNECGAKKGERKIESSYSKSDFVPGDEIIFDDDFSHEQLGEFPSKWDLVKGNSEVVKYDGKMAVNFESTNTTIAPLMKNSKNYLTSEFTIEFDFFAGDNSIIDEGLYSRSQYFLKFYNAEDNSVLEYEVHTADIKKTYWNYKSTSDKSVYSDYEIDKLLNDNEWNHFALSFNKRALKVYINGTRVTNVPNVQAPTHVELESRIWQDHGVNYITNFRICKGAVPLYDRLTTDGKIITYAITFDVGKSTIKPESMVEINRIKGLMDENPMVKFEVQGHTDNTGSVATNDKLSQQRAEAIVARLIELGISADRLTAVGKGSKESIADNSTDEGRAKNRRVEFVKK